MQLYQFFFHRSLYNILEAHITDLHDRSERPRRPSLVLRYLLNLISPSGIHFLMLPVTQAAMVEIRLVLIKM